MFTLPQDCFNVIIVNQKIRLQLNNKGKNVIASLLNHRPFRLHQYYPRKGIFEDRTSRSIDLPRIIVAGDLLEKSRTHIILPDCFIPFKRFTKRSVTWALNRYIPRELSQRFPLFRAYRKQITQNETSGASAYIERHWRSFMTAIKDYAEFITVSMSASKLEIAPTYGFKKLRRFYICSPRLWPVRTTAWLDHRLCLVDS